MPSSATRLANAANDGRNSVERRRSRIDSTKRRTAASYSSSGTSQLVWTLASRSALIR